MLGVTFLFVGRVKERYFVEALEEYVKRLRPFCNCEVAEIPERRLPEAPSVAQIDSALAAEADAIIRRIPAGAYVIPLCVEGGQMSSEELAGLFSRLPTEGVSKICFIVGGSFGLHESVKSRGARRLSMSRMTLPHSLARVVLAEQVYRGFSIAAGTKYHK